MAIADRTATGLDAQLSHDGSGNILVQPADYDAFLMSQRDAVDVLRNHHALIEMAEKAKEQVANLFMDIAHWGRDAGVARIVWGPRKSEGFFAVVASDEDPEGTVQESLSKLDYTLYHRYKFRLSFVLFRASEGEGVTGFIDPKDQRAIYSSAGSAIASR